MADDMMLAAKHAECISNTPLLMNPHEKNEYCRSVVAGGAGNTGHVLNRTGVSVPMTLSTGAGAGAPAPATAPAPALWAPPPSCCSGEAYGYGDSNITSFSSGQLPFVQGVKGRCDGTIASAYRGSQGAQRIAMQDTQISGITPRQKLYGSYGAEQNLNHSFKRGRGCNW